MLPKVIRKYGKWKLMVSGAFLMVLGGLVVGAAGSSFPLVLLGLIIKGTGMGPIMSGIFAMTADVVDYGEWKTGVRSEGLVNCCNSFGMKESASAPHSVPGSSLWADMTGLPLYSLPLPLP